MLDKESKILESTLVNYHYVIKESDYIDGFRSFKKEFDNLNTLHKEFMKRETFALAQKMLQKEARTKGQMSLVNDLLDSLVLNRHFEEVLDEGKPLESQDYYNYLDTFTTEEMSASLEGKMAYVK